MIKYEVEVYANGGKWWYLNGKLHREDGPAIEYAYGGEMWCLNGELHREDGPAIELANGSKEWYLNSKLHREDGPAIEYANGDRFWYLNDDKLTEEAYKKATTKATCAGKEVEIDGVTYVLKLKGQDDMKQVTVYELDETLSDHREYTREEINDILSQMFIEAHKMGYKDVTFKFESTMEPYEEYLGSPVLQVNGWIAKTERDLEAEAKEKEQDALAKKLGCTFYEAGQYMMLRDRGVIK